MNDMERRDNHRDAVCELLGIDPLSNRAHALRADIEYMERADPTLMLQRCRMFAAHVRKVGEVPVAERMPVGEMMT